MRDATDATPPPSRALVRDEEQGFALARDGTRLFVRSRIGGHDPSGVRAILCDGIAPVVPLTHWHYRGHGRSAAPADPDRIDVAAHADDLSTVRRYVGNPPCVLIGHSMGCQVLLENYRQNPEGVRGIILI